MNIFEVIYNAANELREMSAQKAIYSIAAADKNLKQGNRHGRDLTFQGKTFERLYKEGKEIYRHWTEDGAELKDMGDFIKEFAILVFKNIPASEISHYKYSFIDMVQNFGDAFVVDIGYAKVPKPDKNGVYHLEKVNKSQSIQLMIEDYFSDAEHEFFGDAHQIKISWQLKNIRRWRNGEITVG